MPQQPGTGLNGDRELSPEDIRRSLAGSPAQRRQLAAWLLKVVDEKVRINLRPIASRYRRDLRDEAADIVQDVMVLLFHADGRVLRTWDPHRGMQLRSFISLIVRRNIFRTFRGFRGNPWVSDPAAAEEVAAYLDDGISQRSTLFSDIEYWLQLYQILDKLEGELSERDWRLFNKLFVEQHAPADVGDEEGMQENAVHQWMSRLKQRIRAMFPSLTRQSNAGMSKPKATRERAYNHV